MEAILATACHDRSAAARLSAWGRLPAALELELAHTPADAVAATLARHVAASLDLLPDRCSARAVEAALSLASRLPSLDAALPAALTRAVAATEPTLSPQGKARALRALRAALSCSLPAFCASGAFSDLVAVQGALLLGCSSHSPRRAQTLAARRGVRSLLDAAPPVAEAYAAALAALASPDEGACLLLGAMMHPPHQPPAAFASRREAWLKMYVACVLAVNTPAPPCVRRAFDAVVALASADEWASTLLPSILRCLKRSPDAALPALPALLAALPATLPPPGALAVLAEALHPSLLSASASRVDGALAVLAAFSRRAAADDAAAALSALASLPRTSLTGEAQRAAVGGAMREIAEPLAAPPPPAAAAAVERCLSLLLALLPKETSESARGALLGALARLLARSAAAGGAAAAIAKGLGEKNAEARRAHLGAVFAALSDGFDGFDGAGGAGGGGAARRMAAGLLDALVGWAEPLFALVRPALKKGAGAGARSDAVVALCCLHEAATVCPAVEKLCAAEKLWASALKPKDSFLWQHEGLWNAPPREIQAMPRLLRSLTRSPAHFALCGDGGGALLRALCQLSIHPAYAPRRVKALPLDSLPESLRSHEALHERLLHAAEAVARKPLKPSSEGGAAEPEAENERAAEIARAPRLSSLALAALSGPLEPALLPRFLMLSHQPSMLLGGASGPWLSFCSQWERSQSVGKALEAQAKSLSELLGGKNGAFSDDASTRQAALAALRSVLGAVHHTLLPELMPVLLASLLPIAQELEASTESDAKVLQTPQGKLSTDAAEAPRPSDGAEAEAEDYEAEVRAALKKKEAAAAAKAKPEKKGPSKQELKRQQQMESEAVTRVQLQTALTQLQYRLELVLALCEAGPSAVQPWLAELLPLVLPLPRVAVLRVPSLSRYLPTWDDALLPNLFHSLAGCGGNTLRQRQRVFGQALLESLAAPAAPIADAPSLVPLCASLLDDIHDAHRHTPLPHSAVSLLLPVIRRCLAAEPKTDETRALADGAFSLLCHHCAPLLPLQQAERRLQVQLLLAAMSSRGDRWRTTAATALLQIAATLQPDNLQELLHSALYAASAPDRLACIRALAAVPSLYDSADPEVAVRLWVLRVDDDIECASSGDELWRRYDASSPLPDELEAALLPLLCEALPRVRAQAARALAAAAAVRAERVHPTLTRLFDLYKRSLPPPADAAAPRRPGAEPEDSGAAARQGVALALGALGAELKAREQLPVVFAFLKRALGDAHEDVAQAMMQAGREIIERQPRPDEMVAMLVPMFEAFLAEPATTEVHDRIRQGVVLYMGSLAKHIPPDDPKVAQVVERLMSALGTPSESVQRTISMSLASLMSKPAVKPNAPQYLAELLSVLLSTPSYAKRRGAAFGLAGVVKGIGILSLKQHDVMAKLRAAIVEKKKGEEEANAREGALYAFECLAETLGRLFEPYIVTILPLLLHSVSDGSGPVRAAAVSASQHIMAQLSAQGIKMVLPALLSALNDEKWRTKHAAAEILGSMAYCSPKQLSKTLPEVVPALTEVLTNAHPRVKESANAALASVGGVIKNPEILELVPTLLDALSEPAKFTTSALDALAHCQFEHCVDSPSLALIVPVLHRGLRERAAQSKRKTSHITGNMCSLLADRNDIVPYLPLLLPELKSSLHDPIPEVRSSGAKAIGRLCAGLGEEHSSDLLPWLMASLSGEGAAVERAGAAQGLAEVLSALGDAKVAQVLPTLIDGCRSGDALAREGFLMLWVNLPAVLGARFEPFLDGVIPAVLEGLADDVEAVREAAMLGAQALIAAFLHTAAGLLVPPLRIGLADDNYRIRQSSAALLGDLLMRLTNNEPIPVLEEGEENAKDSPLAVISPEQQRELLAAIYIARSDVQVDVRQSASTVWKGLISNAPRALRIILTPLTGQLVDGLSSSSDERQQAAARALGELVSKLSDRVLPKLIPILERGLKEGDCAHRQGVCLGLAELMSAAGRESVVAFLGELVNAVRCGLCDEEAPVRKTAAHAFNTLQRLIGVQAVQEIVPALLQLLRCKDPASVVQGQSGLREVTGQRPQAVVPYLLPKLCTRPMTVANATAISAIADVAGAALHTHLDTVLETLLGETFLEAELAPDGQQVDVELRDALVRAAKCVALAVQEDGLHYLGAEISAATSPRALPHVRVAAAALTSSLCKECVHDLSPFHPTLMQSLVGMFHAEQPAVLRAGLAALDDLVKSLPKERYALHVTWLRQQVQETSFEYRQHQLSMGVPRGQPTLLPAFTLPSGIGPLVAIHLQGLMTGSPELREQAAAALGELVDLTPLTTLKPYVIQITGPLIRIVGDRFPWGVKAEILHTLSMLISKGAALLKPFVPQLQTTFVKALSDTTRVVRMRGATALCKLVALSARVEPLATELLNTLASADPAVQNALLCALGGVLRGVAKPLSDELFGKIKSTALTMLCAEDDELSIAAASLVGSCGRWVSILDLLHEIDEAATRGPDGWKRTLLVERAHLSLLRSVPAKDLRPGLSLLLSHAEEAAQGEKVDVRQPACHALVRIAAAMAEPEAEDVAATEEEGGDLHELALVSAAAVPAGVYHMLAQLLADRVLEVRMSALHSIKTLCKLRPAVLCASGCRVATELLPGILACLGEKRNVMIVSAAQRCLMHVVLSCNWSEENPPSVAAVGKDALATTEAFIRKHLKKMIGQESEAEHSDEEPA
ncbi:hypothetical protein AB1Y20_001981 [Prymnesium parvum]|uniref:TOG domain-containing protein n=1 Tax=Prymnesium parvum TaxID=97485 RepID=A0AB34J849_PRYPA